MISTSTQIDIQFGTKTIGFGASKSRILMSSLSKDFETGEKVEELIDHSRPEIVMHFATLESIDAFLGELNKVRGYLVRRDMSVHLMEALERELQNPSEDFGDDDHDDCGCGQSHDLLPEDEII